MSDRDDGDSAFPRQGNKTFRRAAEGMTLRDYFAGQAMMAGPRPVLVMDMREEAEHCYAMADAMLKERAK